MDWCLCGHMLDLSINRLPRKAARGSEGLDLHKRILEIISSDEGMDVCHEDYGVLCRWELAHTEQARKDAEQIWDDLMRIKGLSQKISQLAATYGPGVLEAMAELSSEVAYDAGINCPLVSAWAKIGSGFSANDTMGLQRDAKGGDEDECGN